MSKTRPYYYCNVVGNTNIGCKRQTNEDWLDSFECENGLVAVVCDGMGGHVGGQIASHTAVDAIKNFLLSRYFDNPQEAIVAACDAANQAILQKTRERPELNGMGSTCVMLIVRNGKVYIGSVGDSRVYLIRSKKIHQLTKDQSYVQMLVDLGEISKEQAEHHPRKNEITNALGLPSMQPATVLETPINPEAGDCFLLCSDGLSGMVSDEEIARVVSSQSTMSQKMRVDALIERARKHGGLDNITCQIVEFAITPPTEMNKRDTAKKMLKYVLPAVAAVILLSWGGYSLWKYIHRDDSDSELVSTNNETNVLDEVPNAKVIRYDTLFYGIGKKVLEIEENKGYDALTIHAHLKDKDTSHIIKMPLTLSSMRIMPADTSFLSVQQDSLNVNKCFLVFGKECKGKEISLRFDYKDSTYIYVFPVANPGADNGNTFKNAPIGRRKRVGKGSLEVMLDDTVATIQLGKGVKEQKVLLTNNSKYEDANNFSADTIYIRYAIKAVAKRESWYSYEKSDGSDCHITIITGKVPAQNPEIKIPLDNTDKEYFVIKIKK